MKPLNDLCRLFVCEERDKGCVEVTMKDCEHIILDLDIDSVQNSGKIDGLIAQFMGWVHDDWDGDWLKSKGDGHLEHTGWGDRRYRHIETAKTFAPTRDMDPAMFAAGWVTDNLGFHLFNLQCAESKITPRYRASLTRIGESIEATADTPALAASRVILMAMQYTIKGLNQ